MFLKISESNNSDMGAGTENIGLQSKILLKQIMNLYKDKDYEAVAKLYDSLDIDQNFVKEVLQEMEILYTSSKSKKIKKSFDKLHTSTKSAFTRFWKNRVKGVATKDNLTSFKKQKKENKKAKKVKSG